MKREKQQGFTLYELLITLLVIGIVLTIGVPNLSDFTRNGRITGTANDLHSSFMVARSEAARAKANVTICASANPMIEDAACDGASFAQGWIIFVDLGPDLARTEDDENILRRHPPAHQSIDITTNDGATYFSFAPNGLGQTVAGEGPAFRTAMICDERGHKVVAGGSSAARLIVVTPLGRSVVIRDFDLIDDAGGCQ